MVFDFHGPIVAEEVGHRLGKLGNAVNIKPDLNRGIRDNAEMGL